jgi:hypothetical protein
MKVRLLFAFAAARGSPPNPPPTRWSKACAWSKSPPWPMPPNNSTASAFTCRTTCAPSSPPSSPAPPSPCSSRKKSTTKARRVAGHAGRHRRRAPGSVYVIVLEDGLDMAGIGGLMSTAMKYRGLVGAVVDARCATCRRSSACNSRCSAAASCPPRPSIITASRAPTSPVTCAGVRVNPNDIIVADEDGVAVVPRAHAAEILKKAQELDNTEHSMVPVHREVPLHPGGRGQIRKDLTGRNLCDLCPPTQSTSTSFVTSASNCPELNRAPPSESPPSRSMGNFWRASPRTAPRNPVRCLCARISMTAPSCSQPTPRLTT